MGYRARGDRKGEGKDTPCPLNRMCRLTSLVRTMSDRYLLGGPCGSAEAVAKLRMRTHF